MLDNLNKYNIILASASPRRRQLMEMLGVDFTVARLIDVDESYPESMQACTVPAYLSKVKADAYQSRMEPGDMLITADTVVILDNEVIGKPSSADDARLMLGRLSGRTHTVVSGVTVRTREREETFTVTTDVTFATITDEEIDFYVDKFKPLDKAGAYGIQEWIGAVAVKGINGSYYNVMGLPVNHLYHILKSF